MRDIWAAATAACYEKDTDGCEEAGPALVLAGQLLGLCGRRGQPPIVEVQLQLGLKVAPVDQVLARFSRSQIVVGRLDLFVIICLLGATILPIRFASSELISVYPIGPAVGLIESGTRRRRRRRRVELNLEQSVFVAERAAGQNQLALGRSLGQPRLHSSATVHESEPNLVLFLFSSMDQYFSR